MLKDLDISYFFKNIKIEILILLKFKGKLRSLECIKALSILLTKLFVQAPIKKAPVNWGLIKKSSKAEDFL